MAAGWISREGRREEEDETLPSMQEWKRLDSPAELQYVLLLLPSMGSPQIVPPLPSFLSSVVTVPDTVVMLPPGRMGSFWSAAVPETVTED